MISIKELWNLKKWNMYNVCFDSSNTILVFKCGLLCPFDVFWMSMYAPGSLLVEVFHAWSNGQRQRLDYGCFGFIGHWLGTGLVAHCQGLLGPFKYNASTNWKYKLKHNTKRTIQIVRKITWKKLAVFFTRSNCKQRKVFILFLLFRLQRLS